MDLCRLCPENSHRSILQYSLLCSPSVAKNRSKLKQKWATPKQWARYTSAKTVIKLFNHGKTRIGQNLRIDCYVNDRRPTRAIFFSDAKKKVRRQCILNRLHFFKDIDLTLTA